jgi:hypothetical protein
MCLKKIKKWPEKYPRRIIIAILILFCIFTAIVFYFTLPEDVAKTKIVVEPQKLDVSLSPGENFTKTISISVKKQGDVNITLYANKPMYDWVNFSNNENVRVEADRTDYVNVEFEIPENATPGEYKGTIEITHNQSLFSWDDIPGKDSKRLQRLFKDLYLIDWAENGNISKSHDNNTITIIKFKSPAVIHIRSLSGAETFNCTIVANITIDDKEEKVTLKIKDGNVCTLIVKHENGKQNIYRRVKEKIPIILTIKPREIIPKNVSILLVPQNQGKGYA